MLQMAKDQGSQGGCGYAAVLVAALGFGFLVLGGGVLGGIGMLFPSLDWNRVVA